MSSPTKISKIEIHGSDRATFKKCRRRWYFSGTSQLNLRPKVSQSGIIWALWFGTGIHKALEEYYNPIMRRDPVEVFNTWFHETTREIELLNKAWVEENETELHDHWVLGQGMLDYYKYYAQKHDDFDVIYAEHDFDIPLAIRAPGILHDTDVIYSGRMDAVVRFHDTGRYGIIDHKTSARSDEDFFVKLEMDEQCTSYLAASRYEKDVPYADTPPDSVLYNVLRKAYPKPPTPLKNGTPSINRQTESTTAEMFSQYILDNGLVDWLETNPRAQEYLDYLKEVGDEQYVIRRRVIRNDHEIASAWERIHWECEDMVNDPHIYPTPTGDYYCVKCPYRAPCLAMNDGSDYEYMLRENYEPRRD